MAERTNGRELDALIAEKVMGWTQVRVLNRGAADGSSWIDYAGQSPDHWSPTRGVPRYSTDIAAAWLVVEMLSERFHARVTTPFDFGDLYFAGFTPRGVSGWNGRPDFEASADSAPLAICRAALEALNA